MERSRLAKYNGSGAFRQLWQRCHPTHSGLYSLARQWGGVKSIVFVVCVHILQSAYMSYSLRVPTTRGDPLLLKIEAFVVEIDALLFEIEAELSFAAAYTFVDIAQ